MTPTADYHCVDCGERYPLILTTLVDTAIGGIHAPLFQRHGPGCTSQTFQRIYHGNAPAIGTVKDAGASPPRTSQ